MSQIEYKEKKYVHSAYTGQFIDSTKAFFQTYVLLSELKQQQKLVHTLHLVDKEVLDREIAKSKYNSNSSFWTL